ncbi:MAG: hypothetical protein AAF658_02640 [Myxococcota bacterium]
MSELYLYLRNGVLDHGALAPSLEAGSLAVARAWLKASVDPADVELVSEFCARVAEQLGDARVNVSELNRGVESQRGPSQTQELLHAAFSSGAAESTELAAAAVHLLDIAEHMALEIYVAELPSLLARADRSGDAARKVGIARHLRG